MKDRARLGGKLGWGHIPLEGTARCPGGDGTGLPARSWGDAAAPGREPRGAGALGKGGEAGAALPESGSGIICRLRAGIETGIGGVEKHIFSRMSLQSRYLPANQQRPKRSNARGSALAPSPGGSWAGRKGSSLGTRSLAWQSPARHTLAKRAAGSG